MQLAELLKEVPGIRADGVPAVEVRSITTDSRCVLPGAVFVAVPGSKEDGHAFLKEAKQAGAVAAVGQRPAPGLGIPYLQSPDSRLAYAQLAAAWHGHPARQLTMVGVTGTDGKTTTANLLFEILRSVGARSGLISTVNARIDEQELDTGLHVTTPDPMELQALLARMLAAGLTHCVLEATSHGLAQQRVAACEFDIGVITNITHEHLDFHGSYEAYREAKGKLFRELADAARKPNGPEKLAVLNADDQSFAYLQKAISIRRSIYGFEAGADFAGSELVAGMGGIEFRLRARGGELGVRSPLLGAYNASNVLAALAAAVDGLGVDLQAAVEGVASFAGVPGRMEVIDLGQPFRALVDFAHTPNALRQALLAARTLTPGRVIAVFGSAGLRDRAKRRIMARISAELADLTVLTAEDPRTEPLEGILAEMAAGAVATGGDEGATFWRVPDRGEALEFAIRQAGPGDLVIACGKGHEQSMCFGETEHPWDDRAALRAALAGLLGIEGPPMPWLPTSSR
ncbi:MAG: UDP-N-acetylmuramoyl-L-alanyl-D-glutamate--2,6-diaminopimelate ligase [Anaerolineales bacterium]